MFDGLYEFCQLSSGGSVASAVKLNKQAAEIAVNWAGGLHHAKKSEASGLYHRQGTTQTQIVILIPLGYLANVLQRLSRTLKKIR